MRRFICLGLLWMMTGCAGGGAVPGLHLSADHPRTTDDTRPLQPEGWLAHSLESWSQEDIDACLVLSHALADDAGSWLWISLDLPPGAVVRVEGPGALEIVLRKGDRTWTVRDLGLHVPLHGDGNTYLNSETGPITIRDHHGLDGAGPGVRFLARLPMVDMGTVDAVRVEARADCWRLRP